MMILIINGGVYMTRITVPAYGKINLFLDVKNLREDGYHNLETVMQSIKLHDNITISKIDRGINIETNNSQIPTDQGNLAYKAAEILINRFKLNQGVKIYIEKNIPVAAGLAGGSTDAAAVIKGMNELFNLNLKEEEIFDIALSIGSDVPFCLTGGTAFATGRGEKLEFLKPIKKYNLIVVKPPQEASTKKIYQLYDKKDIKIDIPVVKLLNLIKNHAEMNIEDGWKNKLEPVTKDFIKDIEEIETKLINKGFEFTMMTGSGPTVFSLVKEKNIELAKKTVNEWDRENDFITLTQLIDRY